MFNFLSILLVLSGNILQFYDFTIYAFLTKQISREFFNFKHDFYSILFTFLIFAVGYLSRPLGSIIFGYIGDTKGRSIALSKTIFLSTLATFLIGLIPSYNKIGFFAPTILIVLRLLQGISVSGEEGGAVVLLFEKFRLKKNIMGAYVLSSVLIGVVLGLIVCEVVHELISKEILNSNCWRLPFLISFPFGYILYRYRFYLNDFYLFNQAKKNQLTVENPTKHLFFNNLKYVVFSIFLVSIYSVTTSTLIVHLPYYLTDVMNISYSKSMLMIGISLFFITCLTPIFATILDKKNPVLIYQISLIGLILYSPILFYCISSFNMIGVLFGILFFSILISLISSTVFSILIGLFPFSIRFSGVSFAFNASVTIFSSTTPIILVLLEKYFHNKFVPGIYISLIGIIVLTLFKTKFNNFLKIKALNYP